MLVLGINSRNLNKSNWCYAQHIVQTLLPQILVQLHVSLPVTSKCRWKLQWRSSLPQEMTTGISMGSKNWQKGAFRQHDGLYLECLVAFAVTWRIKQISYQNIAKLLTHPSQKCMYFPGNATKWRSLKKSVFLPNWPRG